MEDIQSPTAEIRRGKKNKEKRQKKPQGKTIMSASATQGGHKKERKIETTRQKYNDLPYFIGRP